MTIEIPINKIDYGTNIRMERDCDINELARSIERNDILQPLVVRPKGNRYEVVCGHRRYEALKKVGGNIPVPCVVRSDIEDKDIVRIQLEENLQRKGMSALELVNAFDEMKKNNPKLTNDKIAKIVNRSRIWVSLQYMAAKKLREIRQNDPSQYEAMKSNSASKIIKDTQNKNEISQQQARQKTKIKKLVLDPMKNATYVELQDKLINAIMPAIASLSFPPDGGAGFGDWQKLTTPRFRIMIQALK